MSPATRRVLLPLSAAALLAGLAACTSKLHDTGYVGTWTHGNEQVRSTVAIVRSGEGYLFRWGKESADGRLKVRCDWQGGCEEFVDGEKVTTYQFRSWLDEASGLLRVECHSRGAKADAIEQHYVDQLMVDKDGMRLVARTIERQGQVFEGKTGSVYTYTKVSDGVVDPPAGSAVAGG